MRFTTLPQMLAYSSTMRFGRAPDDKIEIIGAFLESNSLYDLYLATIEADIIRPEHHLELPFITAAAATFEASDEDWQGPDDSDRWSLVQALAQRGGISTGDRTYRIIAAAMPLRGLPSAVGASRSTPHADMLLTTDDELAVATVRAREMHPLLALVEGLDALAHLNKPRVNERILAEVKGKVPESKDVSAIDEVIVLGPPAWYKRFKDLDQERRSGLSNAHVTYKAIEQLRQGGVRVSLLEVGGNWRQGLFSIGMSRYAEAPPVEATADAPPEEP